MEAADDPTLEDLLAAARFGHALLRCRPGVDLACIMQALRRRAKVAGRHRAKCGSAHPRYGDGSISAASALAAQRMNPRECGVVRLRELLPELCAACAVFASR